MSSRRREDRSAAASHADPYRTTARTSSEKYHTDFEAERSKRQRSATLPQHVQDPRYDPRYYESKHSSGRTHRQDPLQYAAAAPSTSTSYHQPVPGPSTSRTHQHAARPSAQYPTPGAYSYHHGSSYHTTTAPAQPPPTPQAAAPPSSSRRAHPEAPDPRTYSRAGPAAAPVVQPSYDRAPSVAEVGKSSSRPRTAQSSTQPTHSFWVPPQQQQQQEMPSTRRTKENDRDRDRHRDRDRERERDRGRETERTAAELERDRYMEKLKAERRMERERAAEAEKYKEYRDRSKSRHRKESDSEGVAQTDRHRRHRTEDAAPPSTGQRRQYVEEPPGAPTTTRRHAEATHNPISSAQAYPTSDPRANGMAPSQPGEHQSGYAPPAPRVMPVYLPPKASKTHRSHHERRLSVVAQAQGAQSGSDTERPPGKHRMERTHSGAAAPRNDGYVSSSTREKGGRDAPTASGESKYGSHSTRQPLAQVNADLPHVNAGYHMPSLPQDNRAGGSSVPQFVSIRAGQGPSDPHAYDAYFKSQPALRSDDPQVTTPNHPHPTSASIIKPPAPARTHSYEDSRAHADTSATIRSRADPSGVDPSAGLHVSGREAGQVAPPLSRTASRGYPETSLENSNAAYASSSYPARPPSRSANRVSSAHATPPAVSGPRPLRTNSQGLYTTDPPTRPPSTAPYAPGITSAPSHQSIPPSPANRSNPGPQGAGQVHASSSVHPSPKDAPASRALYHDTHNRPAQMQRAPSGPATIHATPLVAPQMMHSSSQHSRHARYSSTGGDQQYPLQDNRFDSKQPPAQHNNQGGVRSSYTTQSTPVSTKNATIMREEKHMRDQQHASGLLDGVHPQLRQVLSQDEDPYPRLGSMMTLKSSQTSTPQSISQRMTPHLSASRGASVNNSPQAWHKQAPTPEQPMRSDLHQRQPSPRFLGPPQIAIVDATPDSKAGELPQNVNHDLLAPPDATPTRDARTKTTKEQRSKPSRATRNEVHASQQAPPTRQMQVNTQPQPPMWSMYMPPSSSPLANEVGHGQFSPPALPIPPPRGLEDSPREVMETRVDEMVPAGVHVDEDEEEGWDAQPVHITPPAARPVGSVPSLEHPHWPATAPQSHWLPGGVDHSVSVPQISVTAPQVDAGASKPAPPLASQPLGFADTRAAFHPSQGATQGTVAPQAQPIVAPAKMRPKVTIEDVPESPANNFAASAQAAPTSSHPVVTSQSASGNVYSTSSKPAATDHPARASPSSRAKESPSHRAVDPVSTATASTMPPHAPTTYISSRAPLSAPPVQQSFSTAHSSSHQSAHRSASHPTPSRNTQRAAEPVQAAKSSAAYPSSYATHPSTVTAQPSAARQPSSTVPVATTASQHPSASTYPTSTQAYSTTKPAVPATASAYPTATSTYSSKPTAVTSNAVHQPSVVHQHQHAGSTAPSATVALHNVPAPATTNPQPFSAAKPAATTNAPTTASASYAAKSTVAPVATSQTINESVPLSSALGATTANGSGVQPTPAAPETHKHKSSRHAPPQLSSASQYAQHVSSSVKVQNPEHSTVDPTRSRDPTSASRHPTSSSQAYASQARPGTSASTTAQPAQQTHHRSVSVPTQTPATTVSQNQSSPRKSSQPLPPAGVSTQPFPTKPSPPQPARVPVSGHLSTPAPARARLTPLDRSISHESEILKTPSSIAQSPMPQPATVPERQRHVSTDSKDSTRKKQAGIFSLFRTKSGSKQHESTAPQPPVGRTSTDQPRTHVDTQMASSSQRAVKESKDRSHAQPPAASASTHPNNGGSSHPRSKSSKLPDPVSVPPMQHGSRERKDSMSNLFTSLKYLTTHSRRNRTMSGASLDVCDGNTATNTVVESPAQSTVGATPFPPISVRDPMAATSEWRDKEEAERRERKPGKIRRPGVTFDVAEDPPEPPGGLASKKGTKLVRRKSGRHGTPAPRER